MKRKAVIDEGIGETRCAVYEGKKLTEIYIQRWSDANLPRLGDIFAGRVTTLDKTLGAAFVSLGAGPDGLLKFTDAGDAPRLTDGLMVKVEVTREAISGKGPILRFVDVSSLSKPQALVKVTLEDSLKRRLGPDLAIEHAQVNHTENAAETVIALPGGGDIAIEPTRALIAIDVDKGNAQSSLDVSKVAAGVIASQLRLRGLGGLIVIDFPNLRQPKHRDQLNNFVLEAFKDDPNQVKIAPLSRFGTMELTRAIKTRPLDDLFNDQTEAGAMLALKRLEREAIASPGAQLTLTVPHYIHNWLEAGSIDWRTAMTNKIGARFALEAGTEIAVKADR